MEELSSLDFNYKIEFLDFTIKLTLSLLFSLFISFSYRKYSFGINRSTFIISNTILLSIIVTLIISVVKSSLALSLGLVGALSIVRFRNAVKDPLELLIYFSAIGVGLSIGADQFLASLIFTIFISIFNLINYHFNKNKISENSNVLLIKSNDEINLSDIISELTVILEKEIKLISTLKKEGNQELCFEIYDLSESELIKLNDINKGKNISIEILPSIF